MTKRVIGIAAIAAVTVLGIAQSTSSSNTQSGGQQGGGQASGWARASASGRGNSNGSGSASGSMAIPNYALILTRVRGATERPIPREAWEQEVNYWQTLANQGIVTMAGNWREWDGGLVLLSVANDQQAERIAAGDPGVKQGIFTYQLKAWEVRVVGTPRNAVEGVPLPGVSRGGGQTSNSGNTSNSGGGTTRAGGGK